MLMINKEFIELKSRYLNNKESFNHSDVLKALEDGFSFANQMNDFKKCKPEYYEPVLVVDKTGHKHVAWLAEGDDGSLIWTINTTNKILTEVKFWKYI